MKFKRKNFLTAFVIVCLLLSSNYATVSAKELKKDPVIKLMWTNISGITLNLNFSGGNAECGGLIVGQPNTKSISATFTLSQRLSTGYYWAFKTWTVSSASDFLNLSESYSVSSGATYRLSVTTKVTSSSGYVESASDSITSTYN